MALPGCVLRRSTRSGMMSALPVMNTLPEFVGTIHIFLGPCRGNPIGLYLRQEGGACAIAPALPPWNRVVGVGETANKAAADFDAKWKAGDVDPAMYSGPHWEGGIKPDKPKPPPKPTPPAAPPTPPVPASPQPPASTPAPTEEASDSRDAAAAKTDPPPSPSTSSAPDSPASPGRVSEPAHHPSAG